MRREKTVDLILSRGNFFAHLITSLQVEPSMSNAGKKYFGLSHTIKANIKVHLQLQICLLKPGFIFAPEPLMVKLNAVSPHFATVIALLQFSQVL